MHDSRLPAVCVAVTLVTIAATACGGGTATTGPQTYQTLAGTVVASGAPLNGSTVSLYLAGAKGGSATILGAATSAANGSFVISYHVAAGPAPLYVVARGGTASPGAPPNAGLQLMAIAGTQGSPAGTVTINELSTVAAAYAFAQFLNGTSIAGASLGLQVATATALNLITPATGTAATTIVSAPNGVATEALATFDTVANLLSTCTQTATRCAQLFAQTTPLPGGTTAADTLQAAQNIALAPAQNVAALLALAPATSPYQPALTGAPNAWTIALKFSPVYAPGRLAFDGNGNIWVTQTFAGGTTSPGRQITVLNSGGAPTLGSPITSGGIAGPFFGVAVDQSGQIWVGNAAGNSVSVFSAAAQPVPGSPFTAGNLSTPQGLAVDQNGNVWIPNAGNNTLTEYQHGSFTTALSFNGNGLNGPAAVAIDANGSAWVSDASGAAVSVFAANGTVQPYSPITGGGISNPEGIAIDGAGNAWVANFAGHNVTVIGPSGAIVRPSPLQARSLVGPWGDAVDGNNNVWVADFSASDVTELCGSTGAGCPAGTAFGTPVSPSSGYTSAALQHLTAVQIDSAGNVWVCNNVASGTSPATGIPGDGLVEFVGLAGPVSTPLIGPPQKP